MIIGSSKFHEPKARQIKHDVKTVVRKLGLRLYGNKIHCLFGERHSTGQDRNPSCVLYGDHFHCYSCNAHGDAVDLVRKKLGFSFGGALAFLDSGDGKPYEFAREFSRNEYPNPSKVYMRLLSLGVLPDFENKVGGYLLKRGLNPDMCADLGLRCLLDPMQAETMLRAEFTADELDTAGVFSSNGSFMFRSHPLLIPFRTRHEVGYLVGRSLDLTLKPKEIKPRGVKCPYPFLLELIGEPEIYVCEGAVDALSCLQMGLPAIGVPGANCFSEDWLQFIPKSTFMKIVFDSDEAGQLAASKLRDFLRCHGFRSEALRVPAKDVNELLVNNFGGGF